MPSAAMSFRPKIADLPFEARMRALESRSSAAGSGVEAVIAEDEAGGLVVAVVVLHCGAKEELGQVDIDPKVGLAVWPKEKPVPKAGAVVRAEGAGNEAELPTAVGGAGDAKDVEDPEEVGWLA